MTNMQGGGYTPPAAQQYGGYTNGTSDPMAPFYDQVSPSFVLREPRVSRAALGLSDFD